ncbi:MAG: GerMN domain-containing protein [Nitrospirae bacterium]|nr:GerMN domain-containing protein [Nitrospirota bacterium]MBF0535859.1 GerMN domain-containing protein [Nitrospirota bacterium]MBF0617807.1 GerMN domain-containing protein [Nitrospirota bacterium]
MLLIPIFVMAGIGIGYFLMSKGDDLPLSQSVVALKEAGQGKVIGEESTVTVVYRKGMELKTTTIKTKKYFEPLKLAGAAVSELLSGEHITDREGIPEGAKLLGLYYGVDRMVYVDISSELKRNFSGDAAGEFLLLKSLYDTITSNVEADDVFLLINGKEEETLGGHCYIKYPLKKMLTQEVKFNET